MKELNRTRIYNEEVELTIKNATKLQDIKNDNSKILTNLISVEEIFKSSKKIELDKRKLELFLNGAELTHELEDGVYRVYLEKEFIGLGVVNNKLLKRDVIVI